MNSKNSRNLSLEVGKSVFFGHYHQEWPKGSHPQPIEWIVISIKKGSALLLSKHILERIPFDRAVSGEMWIGCTMRKWLNDTFLHEAFTAEEMHCIQISKNTMDESDLYDDAVPYKCTTYDKVFALSQEEICKMSERYLSAESTEYARNRGDAGDYGSNWWWLRTTLSDRKNCVIVQEGGKVNGRGDLVTAGYVGVRPALWLDISKYNCRGC